MQVIYGSMSEPPDSYIAARQALPSWRNTMDILQNWPVFHSNEVAADIWAILPYATLWTIWQTRNDVIFNGGTWDTNRVIQRIKATVWGWLNMSLKSMELRKKVKFTDLLFGWRYVMSEQG
ncbi:hypothetical protein FRX31_032930 [Thalictrum thalictroides]|uniref:Uncharacterized protein n=1 Tax=Thalictrum thalictroides TaxID=46969 RepID=A0A7J6UXZ2_THATH|nr:hypothetical protein FRX31_032930 [Thalictrum thalictroides]